MKYPSMSEPFDKIVHLSAFGDWVYLKLLTTD
jgi:hypothetical protein